MQTHLQGAFKVTQLKNRPRLCEPGPEEGGEQGANLEVIPEQGTLVVTWTPRLRPNLPVLGRLPVEAG